MERVFLVHGWSVNTTETYQAIHLRLAAYGYQLEDIFLGRYVSLDDTVEVADVARAMQYAIDEKLGGNYSGTFHIITHSTGALIVRKWITDHYTGERAAAQGLKNLVFLAGPHFGSRLAHHGKTMLAHAVYLGDTGRKILDALELCSDFSFDINLKWLDPVHWKSKGIRPYCLIGDKVDESVGDWFKSKLFPANYEEGSDMVVRAASGNLNHRRLRIEVFRKSDGTFDRTVKEIGRIEGVPFAALADFTHGGDEHGIMNSIKTNTTPENHLAFSLILRCLAVQSDEDYRDVEELCRKVTRQTRTSRKPFAQVDFHFTDQDGNAVSDYLFKLGYLQNEKKFPADFVACTHKNEVAPENFNAFLAMEDFESHRDYFFELDATSGSDLFSLQPDILTANAGGDSVSQLIVEDHTTQFEIVLYREPVRNLFVFHAGNDPDLHLRYDRLGVPKKGETGIKPE